MPQRPIITRQTAQQLFDWWYAFERPRPGVAAHIALTENESIAIALLTAKHRRDVLAYWSRVKQLIENHVELMDPPAITDSIQLRMSSILSPSTVGSMALAARNDWTFLAEEYMPRVVATVQFHANVASVHRLIAVGASQRWMTTRRAALAVATLVQMGWQSVTFPYTYLFAALRISGTKRWPTFVILAGRFRDAAPTVAIPALFTLLEQVDKGKFPLANARRVRDMVSTSLPIVPNVQERRAWAMKFEREHQAKVHSSSRKCVWAWASGSQ